jgi:hypothetical protein
MEMIQADIGNASPSNIIELEAVMTILNAIVEVSYPPVLKCLYLICKVMYDLKVPLVDQYHWKVPRLKTAANSSKSHSMGLTLSFTFVRMELLLADAFMSIHQV